MWATLHPFGLSSRVTSSRKSLRPQAESSAPTASQLGLRHGFTQFEFPNSKHVTTVPAYHRAWHRMTNSRMNTPTRQTGVGMSRRLLPMNGGKRRGQQGGYATSIHPGHLSGGQVEFEPQRFPCQGPEPDVLILQLTLPSLCLSPSGWCINKREGEGHPARKH